jgi:hypothetical protein
MILEILILYNRNNNIRKGHSFLTFLQEKLDRMQKEATLKAREQIIEQQKQEDEDERLFGSGAETHAPESVSFE